MKNVLFVCLFALFVYTSATPEPNPGVVFQVETTFRNQSPSHVEEIEIQVEGDIEDEAVLRATRRQRIDPDAFEPSSGYKRMSMGPQ